MDLEKIGAKLTSAALSKKKEATNKFFCPSPPPPFHTPPNVHFMWVHAGSSTFRALSASLLHLEKLAPEGEADALYSPSPYWYNPINTEGKKNYR